jgi:hypothetical protein
MTKERGIARDAGFEHSDRAGSRGADPVGDDAIQVGARSTKRTADPSAAAGLLGWVRGRPRIGPPPARRHALGAPTSSLVALVQRRRRAASHEGEGKDAANPRCCPTLRE